MLLDAISEIGYDPFCIGESGLLAECSICSRILLGEDGILESVGRVGRLHLRVLMKKANVLPTPTSEATPICPPSRIARD